MTFSETELYREWCPYCGEPIELIIDPEMAGQSYIEDCQVCCRPITVSISESGSDMQVDLRSENDV